MVYQKEITLIFMLFIVLSVGFSLSQSDLYSGIINKKSLLPYGKPINMPFTNDINIKSGELGNEYINNIRCKVPFTGKVISGYVVNKDGSTFRVFDTVKCKMVGNITVNGAGDWNIYWVNNIPLLYVLTGNEIRSYKLNDLSLYATSGNLFDHYYDIGYKKAIITYSNDFNKNSDVVIRLNTKYLISSGYLKQDGSDVLIVDDINRQILDWYVVPGTWDTEDTQIVIKTDSSTGDEIGIYFDYNNTIINFNDRSFNNFKPLTGSEISISKINELYTLHVTDPDYNSYKLNNVCIHEGYNLILMNDTKVDNPEYYNLFINNDKYSGNIINDYYMYFLGNNTFLVIKSDTNKCGDLYIVKTDNINIGYDTSLVKYYGSGRVNSNNPILYYDKEIDSSSFNNINNNEVYITTNLTGSYIKYNNNSDEICNVNGLYGYTAVHGVNDTILYIQTGCGLVKYIIGSNNVLVNYYNNKENNNYIIEGETYNVGSGNNVITLSQSVSRLEYVPDGYGVYNDKLKMNLNNYNKICINYHSNTQINTSILFYDNNGNYVVYNKVGDNGDNTLCFNVSEYNYSSNNFDWSNIKQFDVITNSTNYYIYSIVTYVNNNIPNYYQELQHGFGITAYEYNGTNLVNKETIQNVDLSWNKSIDGYDNLELNGYFYPKDGPGNYTLKFITESGDYVNVSGNTTTELNITSNDYKLIQLDIKYVDNNSNGAGSLKIELYKDGNYIGILNSNYTVPESSDYTIKTNVDLDFTIGYYNCDGRLTLARATSYGITIYDAISLNEIKYVNVGSYIQNIINGHGSGANGQWYYIGSSKDAFYYNIKRVDYDFFAYGSDWWYYIDRYIVTYSCDKGLTNHKYKTDNPEGTSNYEEDYIQDNMIPFSEFSYFSDEPSNLLIYYHYFSGTEHYSDGSSSATHTDYLCLLHHDSTMKCVSASQSGTSYEHSYTSNYIKNNIYQLNNNKVILLYRYKTSDTHNNHYYYIYGELNIDSSGNGGGELFKSGIRPESINRNVFGYLDGKYYFSGCYKNYSSGSVIDCGTFKADSLSDILHDTGSVIKLSSTMYNNIYVFNYESNDMMMLDNYLYNENYAYMNVMNLMNPKTCYKIIDTNLNGKFDCMYNAGNGFIIYGIFNADNLGSAIYRQQYSVQVGENVPMIADITYKNEYIVTFDQNNTYYSSMYLPGFINGTTPVIVKQGTYSELYNYAKVLNNTVLFLPYIPSLGNMEYQINYYATPVQMIKSEQIQNNNYKLYMNFTGDKELNYFGIISEVPVPETIYYPHLFYYANGWVDVSNNPSFNFQTIDDNHNGLIDHIKFILPSVAHNKTEMYMVSAIYSNPVVCNVTKKVLTNAPITASQYAYWNWTVVCTNPNDFGVNFDSKVKLPLKSSEVMLDNNLTTPSTEAGGYYINILGYLDAHKNVTHYITFKTPPITVIPSYYYPNKYYINEKGQVDIKLDVRNWATEPMPNVHISLPLIYGEDVKIYDSNNTLIQTFGQISGILDFVVPVIQSQEAQEYTIKYNIPVGTSSSPISPTTTIINGTQYVVKYIKIQSQTPVPIKQNVYLKETDIPCNNISKVIQVNSFSSDFGDNLEFTCNGTKAIINLGSLEVGQNKMIKIYYRGTLQPHKIAPISNATQSVKNAVSSFANSYNNWWKNIFENDLHVQYNTTAKAIAWLTPLVIIGLIYKLIVLIPK